MTVRVIVPPAPILTPADIPGSHGAADPAVTRMISAATRTIDGPSGWVGRCFGPQTLEYSGWFGCSRVSLPYRPVIEIVSVITEDRVGLAETAELSTFRRDADEIVIVEGAQWVRRHRHRIRYRAGYDGVAVADGGTGPLPDEVKQAVIILVQHMIASGTENLFLRSEAVEGVGARTFVDGDKASAQVAASVTNLLNGLRVYSL